VQNAVGALAAALSLGLGNDPLRDGLASFEGVRRRQEVVGTEGGVVVIDDFAHHPTAVRETIAAIRSRYPAARLLALFEPRTNTSRRAFFQRDYAAAFDGAAVALIASPFGAAALEPQERFDSARLAAELQERGVEAHHLPSVEEMVAFVAAHARPGDVVLCMSNGGFGGIHQKLLAALNEDGR
jgi:UDP-N-acetylmuramate: L-alanyl-gamma-D-glutamyl-meso-diaminopimelate ligase